MQPRSTLPIMSARFHRSFGVVAIGCVGPLLVACSSGKPGNEYGSVVGTGPRQDAGQRSPADASAQLADAGSFANRIYSGARYLCGYDEQDKLAFSGNSQHPEVAIATDERGFALVHHDQPGNLFIEAVPVAGQAQDPVALLDANQGAQSVALATNGSHFLLAWRTAANGGAVLHARELSSAEHPVQELTHALALSPNGGELSALLALDAGFVAGFVESAGAGASELRLQRLDADGNTQGSPVTIAGVGSRSPEDLHLARLDGGGVLLAWLERDEKAQGRVMALTLTVQLAKTGEAVELSKNSVHDARFDLAARSHSEGLIYHAKDGDVRDAIKYRRVDPQGLAAQAVLNLVNAPGRARDGSIAAFGQGYAVAYRELPSLGVDHPAIHLAFINQFGEVVHEAELVETTESGGRTSVAATDDGHVLVGWTTEMPSSAATHALKLYCPGALLLCGGS